MNINEMTFFELHYWLYNTSIKEVSKILGSSYCKFIKTHFGLTTQDIKKINPYKAAATIGEPYNQSIKNEPKKFENALQKLLLLITKQYERGRVDAKDNFSKGFYGGKILSEEAPDYKNGYEETYTFLVLNSNLDSCTIGSKLGVLVKRLGKKDLQELKLFEYKEEADSYHLILNDPSFPEDLKKDFAMLLIDWKKQKQNTLLSPLQVQLIQKALYLLIHFFIKSTMLQPQLLKRN